MKNIQSEIETVQYAIKCLSPESFIEPAIDIPSDEACKVLSILITLLSSIEATYCPSEESKYSIGCTLEDYLIRGCADGFLWPHSLFWWLNDIRTSRNSCQDISLSIKTLRNLQQQLSK